MPLMGNSLAPERETPRASERSHTLLARPRRVYSNPRSSYCCILQINSPRTPTLVDRVVASALKTLRL